MKRCVKTLAVLLLVATAQADPKSQAKPEFNVPIPIGLDASGIKVPYFDEQGKLQMNFQIGSAFRLDQLHLQMKEITVEMFDQEGAAEMTIDLQSSVLDLETRNISSDSRVTIRRSDFELTGDGVEFDTVRRAGTIKGNIRMLIYNRNGLSGANAK